MPAQSTIYFAGANRNITSHHNALASEARATVPDLGDVHLLCACAREQLCERPLLDITAHVEQQVGVGRRDVHLVQVADDAVVEAMPPARPQRDVSHTTHDARHRTLVATHRFVVSLKQYAM
jgi:hypothetical protein